MEELDKLKIAYDQLKVKENSGADNTHSDYPKQEGKLHLSSAEKEQSTDFIDEKTEERVKWRQEMRVKLQAARDERARVREELQRQREQIVSSKMRLERHQKAVLKELEDEILELKTEENDLIEERKELIQEISRRLFNDLENELKKNITTTQPAF